MKNRSIVTAILAAMMISLKRKKSNPIGLLFFAEREGFEPPVPLGTVVFKTTVIDHSTISPVLVLSESGCKSTKFF